ncbi:MAG TPA: hypothetical protein VFO41_05205 [Alphaproteobacteria bacterium]|nr:hypothetical protein [Alphaproteobacteria bacterium]
MIAVRLLVLAIPVLALVACDVSHRRNFIAPRYTANTFNYAAGGRDLKVEVLGNPTSLDQATFQQAVVDSMQGHNPGQPTHLTLTPGPTARPSYRTVVAFNPVLPVGIHDLCRGRVRPGGSTERLEIRAAFCEGNGTLTSVRGQAPADTPVNSAEFQSLMAGMTRELLPRHNPESFEDRRFGCLFITPSCP